MLVDMPVVLHWARSSVAESVDIRCLSRVKSLQFKSITAQPIDAQTKFFLNRYMAEVRALAARRVSRLTSLRACQFEGKFEGVLKQVITWMRVSMASWLIVRVSQSDVFRKIAASEDAKGKDNNAKELNEVEFLRFLTTQDRTMTRDQVRQPLRCCGASGV